MQDALQIRDGIIIIDHNNDWTEFKKWINGNYANLRFVWGNFGNGYIESVYANSSITDYSDERSYYKIIAIDDLVLRTVVIPMVKPKSLDQVDFEDNFKSDVLPVKEQFDNGEIFETKFKGYIYDCSASNSSSHEIKLDNSIHLEGLSYWTQNSTAGDTLTFQVVDKDNVFGYGANYTLDEHISAAPVVPSSFGQQFFVFNKTYINSNLYLKVTYLNTGDSQVKLGVTYKWLESATPL